MIRWRALFFVFAGCSSPLTIAELRREEPSLLGDGGVDNTDPDAAGGPVVNDPDPVPAPDV